MAANTTETFVEGGAIGTSGAGCTLTAANTARDGTGTVGVAFTASADGGWIYRIRCCALGYNPATVARVYLNNGSTSATATNNSMYGEIALPPTKYVEGKETGSTDFTMNVLLPANYTVLVTLDVAVSAGWRFTGIGATY